MNDVVSFDGVDYQVIAENERDRNRVVRRFKVMVDGKEKYVKITLDAENLGTALEKQAEFAVLHEIKTEIFQHLYNTKAKDQVDKVLNLVGKDDSALDELIANDAIFAAYIRNFHPDQYEEVKRA